MERLCNSKYVCCTCWLSGVGDTPVTRRRVKCGGRPPGLLGVMIRYDPRGMPPTANLYGSQVMIRADSYPRSRTYPTNRMWSVIRAASYFASASRKVDKTWIGLPWVADVVIIDSRVGAF